MPVEVRKKLVSADWACAGCAARTTNDAAATRPKHARETILAKVAIESSQSSFIRRPLMSRLGLSSTRPGSYYSGGAAPKRKRGRGLNRGALCLHRFAGDQVCWIAERSQLAPRGRTKVHTPVASVGASLPATNRPVVRSMVLSTSENRIATLA